MESVKINTLQIENVKRVKAVKFEPTKNGLTIIGGRNKQGKTSVLDSIIWALGGNKYKPSEVHRKGSSTNPYLKVVLSNGLVVERKGKNSTLVVTDPKGNKGGQGLLDSFVSEFALNVPNFMNADNKKKADTLLNIIGVGEQLAKYEKEEKEKFNERTVIGRTADQKAKYAKEMMFYADAPKTLVSASELIKQQQEILARNGENQKKRENVTYYEQRVSSLGSEVARIQKMLDEKKDELFKEQENLETARKSALDLYDESTEELENNIQNIDEINRKVRTNLDKEKAEEDAAYYQRQYEQLTKEIEKIRENRMKLLEGADMPLEGLSVADGELTYQGFKWDNMSGSQQLQVATAIVRKLNPMCGFVLLDKLEQMDEETLNEFGQWLESQGLQAIATRVSTGDECQLIIEDGYAEMNEKEQEPVEKEDVPAWKKQGGWSK